MSICVPRRDVFIKAKPCRGRQWGAQHVCVCSGMGAFPRVIVSAVLAAGFMAGLVGVDNGITEQTDLEAE